MLGLDLGMVWHGREAGDKDGEGEGCRGEVVDDKGGSATFCPPPHVLGWEARAGQGQVGEPPGGVGQARAGWFGLGPLGQRGSTRGRGEGSLG